MQVRTAAAAAAAVVVALLATGCNMFTPQATRIDYDPSDGISAQTGDIKVHNVTLVGEPDGDALSLNATFTNPGKAAFLEVRVEKESQVIEVPSGVTTYGPVEQQLVFAAPTIKFGGLRNVSFQADGAEPAGVPVQMISTEFVGYENLGPVKPEPTPAPTPSAPSGSEPAGTEPAESEPSETEPAETASPAPSPSHTP